nr:TrmB family transcriptional regulator [Archaeoglobus fulgidus]
MYVALLSSGPKTGMELSKLTGDPAPFVYRVLKRLEGKKVVFRISESPMIFKAYPLDIVLSSLIHEREKELKMLSSTKDTIIKLYETSLMRNQGEKGLDFIVVNGITDTINLIGDMIDRAEWEVKNMVGVEGVERIKYWHIIEYERAISRGVSVKLITSMDSASIPSEITEIAEVKYLKIPMNARFVISDDKEILIITTDEERDMVSIYSKNRGLVKTLNEIYEYIWASI